MFSLPPLPMDTIELDKTISSLHAAPFSNQVGGHHACAKIPLEGRIAKPIDDLHEQNFYEHLLQDDLREFVPKYYGVREVEFSDLEHHNDGFESQDSDDSHCDSRNEGMLSPPLAEGEPAAGGAGRGGADAAAGNPWAQQCFEKEVSRLRSAGSHRRPCIILEDLTYNFVHPCVADIKLGTRVHPDDMDATKAARSQRKCEQTTSSSAGLRLCGMQRFDPSTDKYVYVDKYYGRELKEGQLPSALRAFLEGCDDARADAVLGQWLDVLARLARVVASYGGYRFYSSSLLLMYEGDPAGAGRASVKFIDFAHTRRSEGDVPLPDEGVLFGLHNLMSLLRAVRSEIGASEKP